MSKAATPRAQEPEAVPLYKSGAPSVKPQSAWRSAELVPLRVVAERVEAEERAERLRLVTGQRPPRRR